MGLTKHFTRLRSRITPLRLVRWWAIVGIVSMVLLLPGFLVRDAYGPMLRFFIPWALGGIGVGLWSDRYYRARHKADRRA